MNTKIKNKFLSKKRSNFEIMNNEEMKKIVGSGNTNIHSIPPELFEAMFINPSRLK